MIESRAITEEVVLKVPRSADVVWRILSQPLAAQQLMAPTITTHDRTSKLTFPVGPLDIALSTETVSTQTDPERRSMAIELVGDVSGVLQFAAESSGSGTTDLRCAFDGSVTGQFAQLSGGIADEVGATLAQHLGAAMREAPIPDNSKLDMPTVLKCALPGVAVVASAWLAERVRRRRSATK